MLRVKKFFRLLKHDLIACYKVIAITVFGIILSFSLAPLSFLSISNPDAPLIGVTLGTTLVMLILALSILIFIPASSIIRLFSRKLFGVEAYLTLTLPYSTHEIVLSKLLAGLIDAIVLYLTFYLGSYIFLMETTAIIGDISNTDVSSVFGFFTESMFSFSNFFSFLRDVTVNYIFFLTLLLFSSAVGNVKKSKKYRTAASSLCFFIVVFVYSLLTNYIGFNLLFTDQTVYVTIFLNLMALLFSVAMYFVTIYLIDNKVDLD